eukprot:2229396-Rhodomonas_salina.1
MSVTVNRTVAISFVLTFQLPISQHIGTWSAGSSTSTTSMRYCLVRRERGSKMSFKDAGSWLRHHEGGEERTGLQPSLVGGIRKHTICPTENVELVVGSGKPKINSTRRRCSGGWRRQICPRAGCNVVLVQVVLV